MSDERHVDRVDVIVGQWRRERPDLDLGGMEVIGRIARLDRALRPRLRAVFAEHGLEDWEFDVLATLRRSGPPHRLSAGGLLASMMITSGTLTNRLDRLEDRGLIRRENDPDDGRVVLVALTDAGYEVVDAAVTDHAANELALVSALSSDRRRELVELLRDLSSSLEP
ncbi:MAG: MarR family transcriptional regulator [Actinomycetota bacterium]